MLDDPAVIKDIIRRLRKLNPETPPKYRYNLQKLLVYQKQWRLKKPEKEKAKRDKYYTKPKSKELAKIRSYKRRLLKLGIDTAHTPEEWEAKKQEFNYQCAYCGRKGVKLTKDHIVPLIKGGTDSIDNVVPACEYCNKSKGTKDVSNFEFQGSQKALPTEDVK
jgi:5-methylcytosine-specific restriction endonuclease McrA